MEITRELIESDGFIIPTVMLTPSKSKGAVIIVHGYSQSKEDILGLAWRVAEEGFITVAIDLRGHGENSLNLDENILFDVETAISYLQKYGKVTVIGHSLGGRLSIISSADYAIGISPAIGDAILPPEFKEGMEEIKEYRVHKPSNFNIIKLFDDIPPNQFKKDKLLIIHGSRDIPGIISKCEELKEKNLLVITIEGAEHINIITFEKTFETINAKLNEWYP